MIVSISFSKSTEILKGMLDLCQLYLSTQERLKSPTDITSSPQIPFPCSLKKKCQNVLLSARYYSNHLTLLTKINSRWIKNANIRPETIQILEETWEKLIDNSLGSVWCCIFFLSDIKSNGNQSKISKWNYIHLKSFCTEKGKKINKMKKQSMEWENIFANHILQ